MTRVLVLGANGQLARRIFRFQAATIGRDFHMRNRRIENNSSITQVDDLGWPQASLHHDVENQPCVVIEARQTIAFEKAPLVKGLA